MDEQPFTHVVSGRSARGSARLFNYGNIIAALMPFPFGIFWFGGSMLVYALNRHHPNPKVGYYTQLAAYRLYGVGGLVIVAATFFGTNVTYWLITWAVVALVLIPWSVWDLYRIAHDQWDDVALSVDADGNLDGEQR